MSFLMNKAIGVLTTESYHHEKQEDEGFVIGTGFAASGNGFVAFPERRFVDDEREPVYGDEVGLDESVTSSFG